MSALNCRKCGVPLKLVQGPFGRYLRCPTRGCDICQNVDTEGRPVGQQSDQRTRDARKRAHAQFDRLWREGVFASRGKAYRWLADQFGVKEIHISESDVARCNRIAELAHARFIKGAA